jgi:hypothetical protein
VQPRRPGDAVALCLGLALLAGRAGAAGSLAVDPADPRLVSRPDLLERLAATAHGYFRFVNTAFESETCRLFSDVASSMPEVNLHGDAHVEQYAVTSLGRGLTDFDDCTRGKPVIDLVRFGADGPGSPQAAGRGDGQGPTESGRAVAPRERGPGARRHARAGEPDGSGLAGVPGEGGVGGAVGTDSEPLTARGRKKTTGLPDGGL